MLIFGARGRPLCKQMSEWTDSDLRLTTLAATSVPLIVVVYVIVGLVGVAPVRRVPICPTRSIHISQCWKSC